MLVAPVCFFAGESGMYDLIREYQEEITAIEGRRREIHKRKNWYRISALVRRDMLLHLEQQELLQTIRDMMDNMSGRIQF